MKERKTITMKESFLNYMFFMYFLTGILFGVLIIGFIMMFM